MSTGKRLRKLKNHRRRYSLRPQRERKPSRPCRRKVGAGYVRLIALLRDRHDWAIYVTTREEDRP